MGAELPYQICEIGSICRMWRNTQNTHLPCQSTPSLRKVTCPITLYTLFCLFQSTPSLWKVTAGEKMVTAKFQISIHTFPAKGDKRLSLITIYLIISIHTFLAEGDQVDLSYNPHAIYFNPHLPCGRWHHEAAILWCGIWFQSTPSLRKMTRLPFAILCMIHYFNPHLPCGRWQAISGVNYNMAIFQSTPSLRKVTRWASSRGNFRGISIHTFLAECDNQHPDRSGRIEYFNPHLPCGRWPSTPNTTPRTGIISIHTFLAEGDHATGELSAINNQFQSTPSLRKVTLLAKISLDT